MADEQQPVHPTAEITPDLVRAKSFGAHPQGFDPDEVREFLEQIASAIHVLQSQSSAQAVRAELQRVSDTTARIVLAAQQAADQLRSQGADDARRIVEDSKQLARELVERANEDKRKAVEERDRAHGEAMFYREEFEKQRQHFVEDLRDMYDRLGATLFRFETAGTGSAGTAAAPQSAPAADEPLVDLRTMRQGESAQSAGEQDDDQSGQSLEQMLQPAQQPPTSQQPGPAMQQPKPAADQTTPHAEYQPQEFARSQEYAQAYEQAGEVAPAEPAAAESPSTAEAPHSEVHAEIHYGEGQPAGPPPPEVPAEPAFPQVPEAKEEQPAAPGMFQPPQYHVGSSPFSSAAAPPTEADATSPPPATSFVSSPHTGAGDDVRAEDLLKDMEQVLGSVSEGPPPLSTPAPLMPNGEGGGVDYQTVRQFVLQSVNEGSPRDAIERYLSDQLHIPNPGAVVDQVMAEVRDQPQ